MSILKPLSAFGHTVLFLCHWKRVTPVFHLQSSPFNKVWGSSPLIHLEEIFLVKFYSMSECHQAACTDPCIPSASVIFIFCSAFLFFGDLHGKHWSLKENDSVRSSLSATIPVQTAQVYCGVQVRAWLPFFCVRRKRSIVYPVENVAVRLFVPPPFPPSSRVCFVYFFLMWTINKGVRYLLFFCVSSLH